MSEGREDATVNRSELGGPLPHRGAHRRRWDGRGLPRLRPGAEPHRRDQGAATRSSLATPSFVARFRREAQAAARLNHPTIVGVYDTGADGDTQYIVMEFIEGRTLAEFLASGRRPTPVQAVELAQKIATALAAGARAGHRPPRHQARAT